MDSSMDDHKELEPFSFDRSQPFSWDKRMPVFQPKKPRVIINILLFFATVCTTVLAGAMLQGVNPFAHPDQLTKGFPFSFALIFILLSHELGHYISSRIHRIDATLPYFIPAPTFIGTFGAFIKMRSPVLDRRALLDVGAAGPITGFIVALPFLIIGLRLSEVKTMATVPEGGLFIGSSLLLSFLTKIIFGNLPDTQQIFLHPVAFAGWIGLLVTSLNLLPIGQLDGGHIAYAVFGEKQEKISKFTFIVLIALGTYKWLGELFKMQIPGWEGWLIWALLLQIMGLKHPPPLNQWVDLDPKRKVIGWIALGIFVITFTPVPFGTF
jgi:membrane-associated protease RseP (regulator of RpoE activity)